MTRTNEITYAKIKEKGARPGCVLDNIVPLFDIGIADAIMKTHDHISKCIKEIEESRGKRIKHFYIGKSSIRKKKNCKFNILRPTTWRIDGLSSRYSDHRKKRYGRNGLIVLTALTEESIPKRGKTEFMIQQEEYALKLEKCLIEKFKDKGDRRLVNETTDPGSTVKTKSAAHVVYMAFALDGA